MDELLAKLVHSMRNRLNAMVLEATDLGERLAERLPHQAAAAIHAEVQPLIVQARDAAQWLKTVRDRATPPEPRPTPVRVRQWAEPSLLHKLAAPTESDTAAGTDAPDSAPRRAGTHLRIADDIPQDAEAQWDTALVTAALRELWLNAWESIELDHPCDQPPAPPTPGAALVTITLTSPAPGTALWTITSPAPARPSTQLTPEYLATLGHPGHTRRRQHLGLGCSFAVAVARQHHGQCTWRLAEKLVIAELALPMK